MLEDIEKEAKRLGYKTINYRGMLLNIQSQRGLTILIRKTPQQSYYVMLIKGREVLTLNIQHKKLLLLLQALALETENNISSSEYY